LEPINKSHAQKLFEGYCDEKIYEYIESDLPLTLKWLESQFEILEKGEWTNALGKRLKFFDWAVFSKVEMEYIGRSEFTIYENGDCNVAYVFFSKFWRKGYGFEAMEPSLKFVKENSNVKRFIIECDTFNIASMKMAEKLGFTFVETKLKATQLKNRVGDDHVFELFNKI
jgi:RimJ/RimL family protein N-acetyltransferase